VSKYDGHTPGPWQHYAFGSDAPIGPYIVAVTVNTDGQIGPVRGYTITCGVPRDGVSTYWPARGVGGRSDEEAEANARLIADAPLLLRQRDALLEAAKVCETWLESPPYTESDKHVCRQSLVKLRSAIADAEKTTD